MHQTLRCIYDVSARSSGLKVMEAEDEDEDDKDRDKDEDEEMNQEGHDRYVFPMRRGRSIMSPCARDFVAECRRCAKVVCRVSFSSLYSFGLWGSSCFCLLLSFIPSRLSVSNLHRPFPTLHIR